ncbi:MAG: hypothetical protein AAFN10_09220 [Bacteroidota bacterium]
MMAAKDIDERAGTVVAQKLRSPFIMLLAIVILLAGCFNIRPVEPPSSSASNWVSPTDYQILLDNLQQSVNQRNVQNYLRCFNQEQLEFQPVASLFNNNENIWVNWSISDEQAYFDNFVADLAVATGNSLSLTETDLQDVTSDSLKYVGDYLLRVNHSDTSLTTLFQGQLQLVIKLNAFNEWEIERWTDIEIYQDSSWSELKLRYVQ